jgi:hypothetical protein
MKTQLAKLKAAERELLKLKQLRSQTLDDVERLTSEAAENETTAIDNFISTAINDLSGTIPPLNQNLMRELKVKRSALARIDQLITSQVDVIWEIQTDLFRREAKLLEEDSQQHHKKTESLLDQLRKHEACSYVPADTTTTELLLIHAQFLQDCASNIRNSPVYRRDIVTGDPLFPLPKWYNQHSDKP